MVRVNRPLGLFDDKILSIINMSFFPFFGLKFSTRQTDTKTNIMSMSRSEILDNTLITCQRNVSYSISVNILFNP